MRAVVLVSGGMDSLVTAATAVARGRECAFLHVTYGQRTADRERASFDRIADHYRPYRRLVADVTYLTKIGGSSLTDRSIAVAKAGTQTGIPSSYVPFRNAHLIAIATSLAEVEAAEEIYIGATQVDYSGYPDCRREFFDAMERAIDLGTRPDTHIRIVTPIIDMTKAEIVREGLRLGTPFEHSWSCYERSDVACGVCDSCALRLKGFAEAGAEDPIRYA
jgi:7-cyano-7-deazaguanine synthase